MSTGMIIGIVIVAIIVILVIWYIATYNSLVQLRNRVKDQWSQIDVQLKRRADLIPNLVETVKGYAKHESSTLDAVINARNSFNTAGTKEEEIKASGELTGMLNRLFALAEAYPDFYNDTVLTYNNKVQTIPSNIVASLAHFKEEAFFEIDEKDKDVPKVSF